MKTLLLQSRFTLPAAAAATPKPKHLFFPASNSNSSSPCKPPPSHGTSITIVLRPDNSTSHRPRAMKEPPGEILFETSDGVGAGAGAGAGRRMVMAGATSLGVMLLLMMGMEEHKAFALGPEGPLAEEFWDNLRRYALYALTVSTGAIYTILQPILELLKNPISAVLILLIIAGSVYILSQVLSAMVGFTDFSYDYAY